MTARLFLFVWKSVLNTVLVFIYTNLVSFSFKANQPMTVPDAPKEMT